MNHKDFDQSFEKLSLGEMSEQEILQFYEAYRENTPIRKRIVDEIREQFILQESLSSFKEQSAEKPRINLDQASIRNLLQSKTEVQKPFPTHDPEYDPTFLKEQRKPLSKWISLAALIVVSLLLAWIFSNQNNQTSASSKKIATLVLAKGSEIQRDSKTIDYEEGMDLYADDVIITRAFDRCFILYHDGTTIRLNEASRLKLADKSVVLYQGSLRSKISKQTHQSFQFYTKRIMAEVLGTILHLEHQAQHSRLQVFEGKVRATRLHDRAQVTLQEGWQVHTKQELFEASPMASQNNLFEGLVGSWTMSDYKDRMVLDFSGKHNHAQALGQPELVRDSGHQVLKYNRLFSDNLMVPNHESLNFKAEQDFTFIIRLNTKGNDIITLLEKRPKGKPHSPGYVFFLSNGFPGIQLNHAEQTLPQNILSRKQKVNDGRWHQIIVSVRRSKDPIGIFYIDGQISKRFVPQTTKDLSNIENLYIGGHTNNPNYYFNGYIDEVHIYNRYFNPEEARHLYGHQDPSN